MNEKPLVNPIAIKQLPFFKKGCLVFVRSGHELEESSRHYRCKEHCKSESGEQQIKKENLRKNFQYFAEKFCFELENIADIGNELLKKHLAKLITSAFDGNKQDILDATIASMDRDVKNIKSVRAEKIYEETGAYKGGGKIKKEDITTFKNIFIEQQKDLQPMHLFAVLISYMKTLSDPRYRKHLGRGLALITKKIYLSDRGKIVEVEFERWGWYILNYIDHHIPGYLSGLEKKGIVITNGADEILDLEIEDAIAYFNDGNFLDAMHWFDVGSISDLFTVPQTMIKAMDAGPEDVQKAMVMFLEFMKNNPSAQLATGLYPAVGKGIKRKKW